MGAALYVNCDLREFRVVSHEGLDSTSERHRLDLGSGPRQPTENVLAELDKMPGLLGLVIEMERGWPGQFHLRTVQLVRRRGKRIWFYWPHEQAVECIDRDRLRTYWRLWAFMTGLRIKRRLGVEKERALNRLRAVRAVASTNPTPPPPQESQPPVISEPAGKIHAERSRAVLQALAQSARPIPLSGVRGVPRPGDRVPGTGIYLRTDYWAKIKSGGSYGHTCYVAKELAAVTERFVCFMGSRFPLLDEMGLHQVALPLASETSSETDLLAAHWFYYPQLKLAMQALRPAYIYERLCQANFCGAALSHELGIPYIVEYNGSEISMTKSFGGVDLLYEDVFIRAEDVAFQQATLITVVSQVVKQSLVDRGVDPDKILVNPNGADPEVYAPPSAERRQALRAQLGFSPADRIVGFTGTFGGWHGIDVLAAAIPMICDRAPAARFLLIGDGTHKHQIDSAVAAHGLMSRVKCMGRVPQEEGARLLAACDVFVSPHNSHMVDSKFFGSPTKLFEYMAVGEGIVGSDLEQLGEVLSPALRLSDFATGPPTVTNQRAVLCTPGDVDEFAGAVVALIEHPGIAAALGRNARQAVLDFFSWQRHVENVWRFAAGERAPAAVRADATHPVPQVAQPLPSDLPVALAETTPAVPVDLERVTTGDGYKEEVQNQWNHNPVGSHYAKTTKPHTLEWYLEVEGYRYGVYSPWAFELMEFGQHAGQQVLEIGGGLGTDLSMFARHGAIVTDLDLSAGHLAHAQENFALRGLTGTFIHHDAERLPFDDNAFDVVYSNGVIHHTPNTRQVIREIRRVLKPGGKAIIMVYAEHSLHYWYRLVWEQGIKHDLLQTHSIGEIMSRKVEITENDARPLVKVYTARALRRMFEGFEDKQVFKRQMVKEELPEGFEKWISLETAGRLVGWNVIIKATKPRR